MTQLTASSNGAIVVCCNIHVEVTVVYHISTYMQYACSNQFIQVCVIQVQSYFVRYSTPKKCVELIFSYPVKGQPSLGTPEDFLRISLFLCCYISFSFCSNFQTNIDNTFQTVKCIISKTACTFSCNLMRNGESKETWHSQNFSKEGPHFLEKEPPSQKFWVRPCIAITMLNIIIFIIAVLALTITGLIFWQGENLIYACSIRSFLSHTLAHGLLHISSFLAAINRDTLLTIIIQCIVGRICIHCNVIYRRLTCSSSFTILHHISPKPVYMFRERCL